MFLALGALICAISLFFTPACVSTPGTGAVTNNQQTIANAVEDSLSIGLVPVFTKNPSYLGAATGVAAALGSFSGSTITPDDVNAFLAKTTLTPEDARVVAGLVNAAWATYANRYQQQVGSAIRPDVKLFLTAVSNGILRAVASTPK
jgi:hypothetical protein